MMLPDQASAAGSVCYGKPGRGRLVAGVQLPLEGENFTAYSTAASLAGRTYVHSRVAGIVVTAYQSLATSRPHTKFVYGETGWPRGGKFRPHRTHQNGLSVDFFVPVLDTNGRSQPMPTSSWNKFGYGLEFDQLGRMPGLRIDFEAMAEHLVALDKAATAAGAGLSQVIVDREYLPLLYATRHGPWLKRRVHFLARKPWIRHDEHYHVDFQLPCRPL